MRLHSALIVDEIREREDGSVDLLGLREDLYFDAVPVILERMTLFLEWEVAPEDRGVRHLLEMRLLGPEGQMVATVPPVRFAIPPDFPRAIAPIDPTIFEVPFHHFGQHILELSMGGQVIRPLYLNVFPRENPG